MSLVISKSRFDVQFRHVDGNLWTDVIILNRGQVTRTTLELAPPYPNFRSTPAGGRLATAYGLACARPYTWRMFNGIGFRTWNFPAPKLTPCH
ncbi:hypothetical protein AVEN_246462-1 [Araneus ventricosus]|uniref:Uncharacterized protein n=1 Tax=Araneus ventricosus TaxID=182803 RepID=A0A4Y2EKV8_ARAVE|nr:hypothetical protein AVEN_246462-1 [Araneus ventricosus]